MRIAVVNHHGSIVGGVERYLAASLPRLIGMGHEVRLFSEVAGNQRDGSESLGCPATVLPPATDRAIGDPFAGWKPDVTSVHSRLDPRTEAVVLSSAPAVLFAHDYSRTCISGGKTLHHPEPEPCTRPLGPLCLAHYYPHRCGGLDPRTMIQNYKRNRAHLARAQQYCAVCTFSTHMSAECIRNGIHPSRVTYIRPFSPYTRSAGETAIRSSPLSIRDENEPLHIAFLGRLEPDKGVGMLLRALAVVTRNLGRRMVVTIAGEGRRSIALRKLASGIVASSRGLTIDFTGWLSAEQVKDLLARIDLLAVPSVWPEPFGLVGLDAAAYGVPSAAYAVGGIIDWLVDGQNGHLAKRLTSEGLADAIVECLENPQHHASLCRGALEVSSRFSPETHMKSLEEMLSAAAAISHSPPTH